MFKDFLDGFFEFDTRFTKTISPLIIKPGFLTSEYAAGKRAKYFSPFKFYIFISLVLFALLEISSRSFISRELMKINALAAGSGVADTLETHGIIAGSENIPGDADTLIYQLPVDSTAMLYVLGKDTLDNVHQIIKELEATKDSLSDNEPWFVSKSIEGAITLFKNPGYFLNSFLKRVSQAMFILLPLFAFLIKLLYIRTKRYYIQHFVFSIYFHCFAFIVISIVVIFGIIFNGWLEKATIYLLFIIPVYLLWGMYQFYKQSFMRTFTKFFLLSAIYNFILISVIAGIFMLTLFSM